MKVSKAQLEVLRQMVAGDTITRNHHMGWFQDESARLTKAYKTINLKTLNALYIAGLVEAAGKGATSTDYRITPAGRAIVQAADTAGQGEG